MTDELLPVTQEDRDAACDMYEHNGEHEFYIKDTKAGKHDGNYMVQAFAAHRLATRAPQPANAELVERLRVKKQKLREQIKNCVVVINLMQPELDRFEKREGHNIYATRLAVDHQSNMRSLIKEADDLDSAIAALSTPDAGLLDEVVKSELPDGCFCSDVCMAPVIMGRQMPCRRLTKLEGKTP